MGILRSGSTLVYQVLKILFPRTEIIKRHHFGKKLMSEPIVATYRDFRDILVSTWRVFMRSQKGLPLKGRMTAEDIEETYKFLSSYVRAWNRGRKLYQKQDNVLWLKYEDFYNDYDFLFKELEDFFKIEIPHSKRSVIESKTALMSNKKRATAYQNFSEYDVGGTEIHGHHIYKAEVGGWKKVIPEDLHELVEEKYATELKEWGYICLG